MEERDADELQREFQEWLGRRVGSPILCFSARSLGETLREALLPDPAPPPEDTKSLMEQALDAIQGYEPGPPDGIRTSASLHRHAYLAAWVVPADRLVPALAFLYEGLQPCSFFFGIKLTIPEHTTPWPIGYPDLEVRDPSRHLELLPDEPGVVVLYPR